MTKEELRKKWDKSAWDSPNFYGKKKEEPKVKWNVKKIESFIDNFKYYQHRINVRDVDAKRLFNVPEIIKDQFCNGFCYQFAMMLKYMIGEGTIYYAWPVGHFVYEYKGKYLFDIRGRLSDEQIQKMYALVFIPECDLSENVLTMYYHIDRLPKEEHNMLLVKIYDECFDYIYQRNPENITRYIIEGIVDIECEDNPEKREYYENYSDYYKRRFEFPYKFEEKEEK